MKFFERFSASPVQPSVDAQILEHERRLATLEEQFRAVARRMDTLDDHVDRQTQRLLRRATRDAEPAAPEGAGDPANPPRPQPTLMPLEQAWAVRRTR